MQDDNNNLRRDFHEIFEDIKNDVTKTQFEIMVNANVNLVKLYFRIGKTISKNSNWGDKFIDFLSMELKMAFPRQKGFSIRNLKYMKSFYTEYKDDDEFVQLVAQIPWKHNIILMQKIKDKNIRKWYIEKVIEE